jgi:hypothetical protein
MGRRRVTLVAAACLLLSLSAGAAGAGRGPAAVESSCSSVEKAQYQAAASAYARQLLVERARYFKSHKRAKPRAAFVKAQKAKLAALRLRAGCDESAPPAPTPPPIDLNPSPSASESFNFGPGLSAADQGLIKGDIAFAAEDERRLIGVAVDRVVVFASTDANWLAGQQCGFYGYGGSCVADTASFYASGNSSAQGGPGAVFLYWAASAWQGGNANTQKIIAHELFHALGYQIHQLVHAGETPPDQVRPTGPVWLHEGAPEAIGYRVAADRQLDSYPGALNNWIAVSKQIAAPLEQLERLSQTNIPGVYSLFALSVDHLLAVAPSGATALAAYYSALRAGAAWPDAFRQAFGIGVPDYYANFAAYRAKL